MGEHERGGTAPPAGEAGKTVRAVAHERQPVRYRGRGDPVAFPDPVLVGQDPRAPVQLDDPPPDDALGEILVRGADEHLVDSVVVPGHRRRRCEGVIGLQFAHREDPHAERFEGLLEQSELGLQLRRHLGAVLVAGPHLVAERFDDVIGCNTHMGYATGQERGHRPDDAAHRPHLGPVRAGAGRPAEELAEELVGAVDQIDLHGHSLPCANAPDMTYARQNQRADGRS